MANSTLQRAPTLHTGRSRNSILILIETTIDFVCRESGVFLERILFIETFHIFVVGNLSVSEIKKKKKDSGDEAHLICANKIYLINYLLLFNQNSKT